MNAREIHKRATDRALMALELRRQGLTLAAIGAQVGESGPVCRERARQLVMKGERIEQRRAAVNGNGAA
jgi:hypothetical protein